MNAVQLRRWNRREYDRMIDAGVLRADDRVELIDGEIVTMPPQKSRHATAVRLAEIALRQAFGDGFDIRTQLPLALDSTSEPEPDVAVVVGAPRTYRDQHPPTALLVVEVADVTLTFDRTVKASVYARARIADYWLLNLVDGVLDVHRSPEPSPDAHAGWRYASIERYGAADAVAPLARQDRPVRIADLLP
jgi:Uma2 family endonuclease